MPEILSILSRPEVYLIILSWTLIWKGIALWSSASRRQLVWFTCLLLVNTLGVLEILYIFYLNRWDLDQGRLLKYLEKKIGKKL